ncbi:MAG: type II toxin-antitoxin system death-on-curing family toxin [Tagaea sp.]|nr:type II toxin-antitoxin system death-on-curing family toxin [Tagaea sp.]
MKEPVWVNRVALLLAHDESVRVFGGAPGMRDEGLLDSALMRAENLFRYTGETDVARLAAAYAFGVAKNHPFVDGNKRAAFAAVGMFVRANGFRLRVDQGEATRAVLDVAASSGEAGEIAFAEWLRPRLAPY